MQSRQLSKVQHVRRIGHVPGKWLDERKVDLGVIFESWKSLREKRADTDPGLAFHLMEIHDQYCFCRFEESQSTAREGDMVCSSDVSEPFEHSEQTDEVTERSIQETFGFSHRYPASGADVQLNEQKSSSKDQKNIHLSVQHSHSKAEALGKACDDSSLLNTEILVEKNPAPSQGHSIFPDRVAVSQTSGYSPSVSTGTVKVNVQPTHIFQSEGLFQQADRARSPSHRPADGVFSVKTECIAIDSDPDESEDASQTDHIPETLSGEQTPEHHLLTQQTAIDRKLCASSDSAMSEGFKHLIMEEIMNNGGDVYSGLVPQGTFGLVGSHMNVSSRIIEDMWYKFVYSRSLSANSQARARSRMKKKISKPELEFIAGLRTGNPNITEMEIKRRLKQDLNIEVSQPTINRAIRQELMFVKWNHKRWQMHK